jgi:hypothetical protein
MGRVLACAVAFAVLATTACKGPSVPNPLVGQTRYTCCNMHYENPEISDVNYQKGTLIPFGTRVQILEVKRNSVKFQPEGHPPIVLINKYGKDVLPLDQLMERYFLPYDPHAKLAAAKPAARGAKGKNAPKGSGTAEQRKLIEQAQIEPGMTREQVLMALGYPPAHRTPSLDGSTWTYWQNHWVTFEVYFDGDKVARVTR